jgi:RNA polymerase sigma-70 factor (ECF subfamily)
VDRHTFDEEYVRRLAGCDPQIEEHFTHYFGDLLLIKLRSRLRSRQSIEDARQETFVRVFAALRRRDGLLMPERLGAFVCGVCDNVLREMYRSEARSSELPDEERKLADSRVDAESELVSAESKLEVRRILGELPEKDRQLLKMLFFEERDKEEICRLFNVDREYFRVLVHRAKARFRRSLLARRSAGR